jgi:hypothetical protein
MCESTHVCVSLSLSVQNNCAKINAPRTPYFDGGVITMYKNGLFNYFSSRNSNFSNRRQNGRVCVTMSTTAVAMTSECNALTQDVPSDVPAPLPPVSQLKPDEIPQNQAALQTETFDPAPFAINDAAGDGDPYDCEGEHFTMPGLNIGGVIALAFGMVAVGVVLTMAVQYTVAYVTTGVSAYDFFCRPSRPHKNPEKEVERDPLVVREESAGAAGGAAAAASQGVELGTMSPSGPPPPPRPVSKPAFALTPTPPAGAPPPVPPRAAKPALGLSQ